MSATVDCALEDMGIASGDHGAFFGETGLKFAGASKMSGIRAHGGQAVQEALQVPSLALGERVAQELRAHESGHFHEPGGEAGFEERAVVAGKVGNPGGVISYEYRQAFSPRQRAGGFFL